MDCRGTGSLVSRRGYGHPNAVALTLAQQLIRLVMRCPNDWPTPSTRVLPGLLAAIEPQLRRSFLQARVDILRYPRELKIALDFLMFIYMRKISFSVGMADWKENLWAGPLLALAGVLHIVLLDQPDLLGLAFVALGGSIVSQALETRARKRGRLEEEAMPRPKFRWPRNPYDGVHLICLGIAILLIIGAILVTALD